MSLPSESEIVRAARGAAYRAGFRAGAADARGLFPIEVANGAAWARRLAQASDDRSYWLGMARGLRAHVWQGDYGIPD